MLKEIVNGQDRAPALAGARSSDPGAGDRFPLEANMRA